MSGFRMRICFLLHVGLFLLNVRGSVSQLLAFSNNQAQKAFAISKSVCTYKIKTYRLSLTCINYYSCHLPTRATFYTIYKKPAMLCVQCLAQLCTGCRWKIVCELQSVVGKRMLFSATINFSTSRNCSLVSRSERSCSSVVMNDATPLTPPSA